MHLFYPVHAKRKHVRLVHVHAFPSAHKEPDVPIGGRISGHQKLENDLGRLPARQTSDIYFRRDHVYERNRLCRHEPHPELMGVG